MRYFNFLLCMVLLFVAACNKENGIKSFPEENSRIAQAVTATTQIAILEDSALPQQTDAAITTATDGNPKQYIYRPAKAADRKDRLFIMIPGTTATPSGYDDIVKAAAKEGYYAFSVAYDNKLPIEAYEGFKPTDKTVENILEEFLTGKDVSPKVKISRANSFENRIIKMLMYMDSLYPAENWKRFLTTGNTLQWGKLSVCGHSQGSDHCMYMSKKRSLFRAGYVGGPGSFLLPNGQYPSFMQQAGSTVVNNLYGFNHLKDDVRKWNDVKLVWAVLHIPGNPANVDNGGTFGGSHRLTTSLNISDAHSGTIMDNLTPIDSSTGIPVYQPVWKYMNFP